MKTETEIFNLLYRMKKSEKEIKDIKKLETVRAQIDLIEEILEINLPIRTYILREGEWLKYE